MPCTVFRNISPFDASKSGLENILQPTIPNATYDLVSGRSIHYHVACDHPGSRVCVPASHRPTATNRVAEVICREFLLSPAPVFRLGVCKMPAYCIAYM